MKPSRLTLSSLASPRGGPRASTSSSAFFPVQPSPSTPIAPTTKPPSSLWYTGRPSLSATLQSLQTSLTSSRAHLFRAGLLPSISASLTADADFANALPHPRARRWKTPEAMAAYLRTGADLRSSQYKRLTALLASLEGLLPYAELADRLPHDAVPALELDPVKDAINLHHGTSASVSSDVHGLKQQLEHLLAQFVPPVQRSGSGQVVERVLGKERRLGQLDKEGRVMAVGRRKESGARVWIVPAAQPKADEPKEALVPGRVLINTVPLPQYFSLPPHRASALFPLKLTSSLGSFNVFAIAKGGGLAAQADAVAMGIARALVEWERLEVESGRIVQGEDEWRELLKKAKLLARDPRVVERKKTGQPKARKKNTWVKR